MRTDLLPTTFEGKLARLIEECGEVLIAVGKLERFGLVATDPKTLITYNNKITLLTEMSDLRHAITELENSFINEEDMWFKPFHRPELI